MSYTSDERIQAVAGSIGGVTYKGTWNAATNTPALANGGVGGVQGDYYVVSVDGSTSIDGITDWVVTDWIINNGTTWEKVDNTGLSVPVSIADGGTGSTTAGDARTALGVPGLPVSIADGGTGAITAPAALTALGAAADADVVHIAGAETITGEKTLNDLILASATHGFSGDVTFQRTATGKTRLTLTGNGGTNNGELHLNNAGGASLQLLALNGSAQINSGGMGALYLNGSSQDTDTIIRGDTDPNLLYVDAGTERVGIGGVPSGGKFEVFAQAMDTIQARFHAHTTNGNPVVGIYDTTNALAWGLYAGSATDATLRSISRDFSVAPPAGFFFRMKMSTGATGAYMEASTGEFTMFQNSRCAKELEIDGDLNHDGSNVGFYGAAPVAKPTITGSRSGNVALADLLTDLASQGLITDSTTAGSGAAEVVAELTVSSTWTHTGDTNWTAVTGGSTGSITLAAGVSYRISMSANFRTSNASQEARVRIYDVTGAAYIVAAHTDQTVTDEWRAVWDIQVPGAGSREYRLEGKIDSAGQTVTIDRANLIVEKI